jgi:hypothetical protein
MRNHEKKILRLEISVRKTKLSSQTQMDTKVEKGPHPDQHRSEISDLDQLQKWTESATLHFM